MCKMTLKKAHTHTYSYGGKTNDRQNERASERDRERETKCKRATIGSNKQCTSQKECTALLTDDDFFSPLSFLNDDMSTLSIFRR
jgi:hypothetical protein